MATNIDARQSEYGYRQRRSRWRGEIAEGEDGGGYTLSCMVVLYDHRPSHPYNAGMEGVGFLPTRQTLLAPRAKRREVLGESHEEG